MCVEIRPHLTSDGSASLDVFRAAIRGTASADYTPDQIEAWASPDIDVEDWSTRRASRITVVATLHNDVVGFTDVDSDGYIDMLFVHPTFGRQGVGTALLRWVLEEAARCGAHTLHTHASITAGPFFESQGFTIVAERFPVIRGVTLRNYEMNRLCAHPEPPFPNRTQELNSTSRSRRRVQPLAQTCDHLSEAVRPEAPQG